MKKILVPIDYSDNSQNALTYAFETARIAGAELILIHTFYPIMSPPASHSAADVIQALEEGKGRSLLEFGEQVRKSITVASGEAGKFAHVPIKAMAKMGGSYEKILEAIDKFNIDLVVMGMQGGNAVSQALLGGTTISVMQKSSVPVLAVPKGMPYSQFANIVFATNLSKLPATTDLGFLREFVKLFQANLQVLHLYQNETQQETFDTTQPLEILSQQFQEVPYTINLDVQENVALGIQEFIKAQQANLLVLIPQRHTMLERLLDKSVTGRVTAQPLVPLLALPIATLMAGNKTTENLAAQPQL